MGIYIKDNIWISNEWEESIIWQMDRYRMGRNCKMHGSIVKNIKMAESRRGIGW